MNLYKIELCVIDLDEIGPEEVVSVLENTKYPNRCISPKVKNIETKAIGEWSDDHPLNISFTSDSFYRMLFSKEGKS